LGGSRVADKGYTSKLQVQNTDQYANSKHADRQKEDGKVCPRIVPAGKQAFINGLVYHLGRNLMERNFKNAGQFSGGPTKKTESVRGAYAGTGRGCNPERVGKKEARSCGTGRLAKGALRHFRRGREKKAVVGCASLPWWIR